MPTSWQVKLGQCHRVSLYMLLVNSQWQSERPDHSKEPSRWWFLACEQQAVRTRRFQVLQPHYSGTREVPEARISTRRHGSLAGSPMASSSQALGRMC